VIDKELVSAKFEHCEHLVISPYPVRYTTLWKLRDGRMVILRPIKPEDEPLWLKMFHNFSEESICFRLFQVIKEPIEHEFSVRYCNIDYDRELAIVAELEDGGRKKMAGVVRLLVDPDRKSGELAFIVADPWQGMGIGSKMIVMEICRDIVGSRCRACKDIQNI